MTRTRRTLLHVAGLRLAAATLCFSTTPALAADPGVIVSPPPLIQPVLAWDLAFGVDVTSQYIFRGLAQTEGPAVQPWAEVTMGPFYAGYWGSNVSPSIIAGSDWESDFSVGIRPMLGPLTLDLGYVRYVYDNEDCCGELYAIATIKPVAPLTLGATVYYDPEAGNTYLEGSGAWALPYNLEFSAAIGNQAYGDGSPSYVTWNAGLKWSPEQWLAFDARYHAGPTSNKFVVTASFDTAWSTIMSRMRP